MYPVVLELLEFLELLVPLENLLPLVPLELLFHLELLEFLGVEGRAGTGKEAEDQCEAERDGGFHVSDGSSPRSGPRPG